MSLSTPATSAAAVCLHCGALLQPHQVQRQYCCAGCEFVHDLIKKNGLGQYYDLRNRDVQPVKSFVFQKRDYAWLEALATAAEQQNAACASLTLDLQGVSCIGCVWLIETVFAGMPGALRIRTDPALGRLDIAWAPGQFDVLAFARKVQSFGYLLGYPGQKTKTSNRALTVRLGICGALALNTMLFTLPGYFGMESSFQFAPLFGQISLGLAAFSLLVGGSYFFARTWSSLRQRVLHIDLPISLGLLAAFTSSLYAYLRGAGGLVYFDFVSIFTFLMLAGRWLQLEVVERNRHRLLSAQDQIAEVQCADSEERLPMAKIAAGMRYFVPPGRPIPVRSRLLSESATLGLEWINGESEALTAPRGRIVSSGAMNYCRQPIECEALEAWPDSLLARLTEIPANGLVRNLQVERFIRRYMIVVLGIAALAFATWWYRSHDFLVALQVLTAVLVVSCPCASGVALPLADDLAASQLRRLGVFLRESSLWARLLSIRKILFDKTGTLTLETMALRQPEVLERLGAEEKAALLALVMDSLHPVSCCLRELLLGAGAEPAPASDVKEVVGFGLQCVVGGHSWRLGRRGWAGDADGDCVFARDGKAIAAFSFEESVRADAREEIAVLREQGRDIFILSGDRREKVAAMAARLGVPAAHCSAAMSPQDKADWVRAHDRRDTLLIGDGANDSLAFNAAWCTGTPAIDRGLLEHKADFYFLGRGLAGIRHLLETAGRRRRIVRRVVTFAVLYNTVAIAISVAGHMSPVVAAVIMPLSSLVSIGIVIAGQRRNAAASVRQNTPRIQTASSMT